MNIKSLLIGSAAALAAVSGAQAADAIVAAEPEPLEYVRVCDAFGTGFFYIPGTETCLKFQGYVRFQTDFNRGTPANGRTSDWNSFTRAQFEVDTRTDTELGALRGFIGFRGNADNGSSSSSSVFVDQAFIELGGLKVGKFYSWWDDSLSGETDELSSNALFNSIRYTYDAGSFWAGVSVDELQGVTVGAFNESDNNVGVALGVGAKLGAASFQLIGGYDTDRENGSVRLIATADVGPGTLGLAGVWASGANAYYNVSEWAVAAEYAIKATDKLTITPGVQYYGNYGLVSWDDFSNDDGWTAGLTLDYKITQGLSTKIAVNYVDIDNRDDQVKGFVRLQRSF
ncbi:porin [Agrobacterium sp. O3.4]|uniref:Porin n=1 Tax=Rhizobium rhizogenes TaxID=359 RepID=A0A546XP59_RHIRH|nr:MULTISPECIES: porin [Rhizobium/Agrobacterium group]MCZ7467922.1 porin [Rhizobium rhizogenes]TRB02498.1 porin [Rhizobium rhizogenes]